MYITMVQVIQRRRVKSWDVLHGHSVPREFRLLHQLQGTNLNIVHPQNCFDGQKQKFMNINDSD